MRRGKATLPLGMIIQGRYIIEGVLGSSGSDAIYLVRDQHVRQDLFALTEMSNLGREEGYRFTFEPAEFKKKLVHPALPQIYDVFHDEKHDRAYLLIEYIEGLNLEVVRLLQPEQRFSVSQVMTIMEPIMDAVIYLHSQHPPLIHGHVKPSNIIESKAGAPTVLVGFDFEKEYDAEKTIAVAPRAKSGYEAPEQFIGVISPRTDIYALGATLYTLLTGTVPAGALNRWRKLGKKEPDTLVPLNRLAPAVPEPVGEVIHSAMSINSDERFATVEHFWEALQQASNATTAEQQTTEPAVTAQYEEKTGSETHLPVQQAVEPQDGSEELATLTTDPAVQQPPEPLAASSASPLTPVISGAIKSRVTRPLQEPAKARHLQKHGMLFLTLFALLVTLLGSVGVGASLWFYITSQHSPTSAAPSSRSQLAGPSPQPTANPQPTVTATVPVSSSFPNLAKLYAGTLGDIPTGVTLKISLTSIQQQQDSISGYLREMPENSLFSQIPKSGPFQGTVNTSKEIQFTLMDDTGQATFSFNGSILVDSSIQGSFCSLAAAAGRCSDYGLWSVSPST